MGKKRTARDERPYFFITRRIPCPPPALEFRKPLSTARSRPAAAPARAENLLFCRLSASAAERAVGTQMCFPANKRSRPKRAQKRRCGRRGKNAAARHERAVLFCDFPAAPRPKDAFSHARAPRRIRDVPRRASGRKRRAPHRAGRRKRPQNDFAESPKASANGENVFSFRKPAPPHGKAATAYGIRSRTNALPQARTAPVMKRPCRARRAALRRTQIGRRECFIGKPYAAVQHKRLFENAAHRHAAAICAPAGCSAPQRRRETLSALRIIDYNKAPLISYE